MAKKKKKLETTIIVVIILIAILLLAFEMFGEGIIKSGVEKAGEKALKVKVEVDDLDLAIYSGKVKIEGLNIKNPEGYENKSLLELGSGKVETSMKSLFSDPVEIASIVLDEITLTIEQKGLTNNLQEVLNNLPKSDAPQAETEGKGLVIKNLQITNTTVKVKLLPVPGQNDTVTLKLDPIEMKDLGTDSKMDMAKLSGKILTALATGVTKQGIGILPDDILGAIEGSLGDLDKEVEKVKKKVEEILGEDAGKEVLEGVKGLFEKKE